MTPDEIRTVVLNALGTVAPEADLNRLRPDQRLREQLDIDSMDFLKFVLAIHNTLGVEIPEADYGQLATLDACVKYLAARVPAGRSSA